MEARRHSLAQLRLLREAADRNEARRGMLRVEMLSAGLAGLLKGSRPLKKLWDTLKQQARL